MTAFSNQHHLDVLKSKILDKSGIISILPNDCRTISYLIIEKTKLPISETTIKRVFGFALGRFNPSKFTLDALSIYCGYQNWQAFRDAHTKRENSTFPTSFNQNTLPADIRELTYQSMDYTIDPIIKGLLDTSTPTLILQVDAPDFTIITYNDAYIDAAHIRSRNIQGLSIWEAFKPANAGSYGPTLLLESFHEAIYKQVKIHMQPLHYNIPSAVRNIIALSWWDIEILPVVYEGVVKYLILHKYNITDKFLNQDAIEQAIIKQLTLAEDLATSNVNLNQSNEKLTKSYEKLDQIKRELEELNKSLEDRVFDRTKMLFESESKQRKLIDNAPVAIAVLKGPEHVIETANKKIIDYWGKSDRVINKPLAAALPELEGQPFIDILNEVRNSGVPYVNPELCAYLNFSGIFQARYYDMIYQPIQHVRGITDSIFIVAIDITEHVLAKQRLGHSESTLRLAVNAAGIGIWSFDPNDRILEYNPMFAKILGWEKDEKMTSAQALEQITDEFRDKIKGLVEIAIANGGEYQSTYSLRRFNDSKIIDLKAAGKVAPDDSNLKKIFSGVIWEINKSN
jgi:PAS domain S-box-containing protein